MKNYRIVQDGRGRFIPQVRRMLFFWMSFEDNTGETVTFSKLERASSALEDRMILDGIKKKTEILKRKKTVVSYLDNARNDG